MKKIELELMIYAAREFRNFVGGILFQYEEEEIPRKALLLIEGACIQFDKYLELKKKKCVSCKASSEGVMGGYVYFGADESESESESESEEEEEDEVEELVEDWVCSKDCEQDMEICVRLKRMGVSTSESKRIKGLLGIEE